VNRTAESQLDLFDSRPARLAALRLEVLWSGLVPVVEWNGLKSHRLVAVDSFGHGRTRCGRMIRADLVDLVEEARALERPRPCLNCHRMERKNP
jgi:hypothetical protein